MSTNSVIASSYYGAFEMGAPEHTKHGHIIVTKRYAHNPRLVSVLCYYRQDTRNSRSVCASQSAGHAAARVMLREPVDHGAYAIKVAEVDHGDCVERFYWAMTGEAYHRMSAYDRTNRAIGEAITAGSNRRV